MKSLALLLLGAALVSGFTACTTSPSSAPETAESRQIDALLRRWAEAEGGAAALKRAASYELTATVVYGPGAPEIKVHSVHLADGRFHDEIEVPFIGPVVDAYDGQVAWQANEQLGLGLMTPIDLRNHLLHEDILEPLRVAKNYPGRKLLPDATCNGKPCHCIELTRGDGIKETWFFDDATGMRVRYVRSPWPGHLQGMTVDESDYRRSLGIVSSHSTRITEGGHSYTVTIDHVSSPPKVANSLFQAPPEQIRNARKIADILARYEKSAGGREAIERIKSRITHVNLKMNSIPPLKMVITQKFPDRLLVESDVPSMGHITQGYDGKTGWAYNEVQGYRTIKGAELVQLLNMADLQSDILLAEKCPFRKWVGEKVVDGRRTYVVALASPQGRNGNYSFDVENSHLLRVESTIIAGPKSRLPATMEFSDFRTVDGLTMPFVVKVDNPAIHMAMNIESVQNNVPVDDTIFKPRKGGNE